MHVPRHSNPDGTQATFACSQTTLDWHVSMCQIPLHLHLPKKDIAYFRECFSHKSKGWLARSMKFYRLTQIMCLLNPAKWEVCMLNTVCGKNARGKIAIGKNVRGKIAIGKNVRAKVVKIP